MIAKLHLASVTSLEGGQEQLSFYAVTNKPLGPNGENEDNTFARYTPSASLQMTISNPELVGKFKPGQNFYVRFEEAD